jgi:hypothetical protein
MDQKEKTRVPWYQRWTTYLTGISGLLAAIIVLTQEGSKVENFVVSCFAHVLRSGTGTHDFAFEKKLEESLFSYRPSVDSFSNIFGQKPTMREEKIDGPTSGLIFSGYSFENENTLLFFVTSKRENDKPITLNKKTVSVKSDAINSDDRPAAVVIGFKVYPEFVKRIFNIDGIRNLNQITIGSLKKICAKYNVMSGYDPSYAGNFVTILGAGQNVFHEGDSGSYGAVFFFPNVVGCGSMLANPSEEIRTKFKDKAKQLAWTEYQSPPGHWELVPRFDKFPMTTDELDCSDQGALGYLIGLTAYSSVETTCLDCKERSADAYDDNYTKSVVWHFFLLHYADEAVGYINRKLELVKPGG